MSVETREREDGNLGRRSLVRAGVWAIPVVTVAAAAPALAVSGTNALSFTTAPGTVAGHRDNSHQVTFTLTLTNQSAVATTGLQAHAAASVSGKKVQSITSIPAASWTSGAADVTTTVAATQVDANGTKVVKLVVVTDNNPGRVTLTFTTSNGGFFSVFQDV